MNLLVAPQQMRRGIGTRLLTHLEAELHPRGGQYLQARVLAAMAVSVRFALSHGFREIHRMRGMTLQAKDFAPQTWTALGTQLAAQGFVVTTFHTEAAAHQQPIEQLARLQAVALQGWPSPDPRRQH